MKKTLKQLRHEKGWTQQDLADKLMVTRTTVGRWEVGLAKPSKVKKRFLAQIFNMDIDNIEFS